MTPRSPWFRGSRARRPSLASAVAALLLASWPWLAPLGCDGSLLDLGARATAQSDASDPPAEVLACPPINEAQYEALRGDTCAGVCGSEIASTRILTTADDVAAALAGQWALCSGSLGPSDTAGIELDPGCIVFLLRADGSGGLVRGTTAPYQGTYDVVTRGSAIVGVALHLATGTIEAPVVVDPCLGRARLDATNATTDGGVIELAALAPSDGGPVAR